MKSMKKQAAIFPAEIGQNLTELGTFKELGYLCLFQKKWIFKIQKRHKDVCSVLSREVSKQGRQLCRGTAPRQHIPDIKNPRSRVL